MRRGADGLWAWGGRTGSVQSRTMPDDAMGCKADGTGSQRATEFCRAINHNEVLCHAIHNLAKLVRIC